MARIPHAMSTETKPRGTYRPIADPQATSNPPGCSPVHTQTRPRRLHTSTTPRILSCFADGTVLQEGDG